MLRWLQKVDQVCQLEMALWFGQPPRLRRQHAGQRCNHRGAEVGRWVIELPGCGLWVGRIKMV